MSMELSRDIINYEKLIGEGTSQTMVNGDMMPGDRNPEIAKILSMDGNCVITSSEVVDDKIIVEGKMNFDILYSSFDENKGIYKMNATSNFTHNIQVPGATSNMSCKVKPSIEHMEHELVNSKKVKVNAIINMKGMVYDKETVEAVTEIKGEDVQSLQDRVEVDEFVGENNVQSIVKGKVELPEDKGEVKNILKTNLHVHKKDVNVQSGKVTVNACVLVRTMYTTNNDEVCYVEHDVAFTNELTMPEVTPDMRCDVSFKVGDVYEDVKENENGERKIIEVEAVVDISGKLFMRKQLQTLIDAYSSEERYELERQNIKALGFFGEGTDSQTLKERVSIPENKEAIHEIKHVSTKPIITDVKIVEDKVLVEGVVNCCIMYMIASDEGGMGSFEEELPFKATVDMPGAKIDMMNEVEANVEHISYDKVSSREVDLKIIVECVAKTFYKTSIDIVKSVTEMELPENIKNMPSIVIYCVQPNDTLWKIAKRYNTTIEDIVKINDIENPDYVEAGSKILVPKKAFMR
jgi:LysM repeat protein